MTEQEKKAVKKKKIKLEVLGKGEQEIEVDETKDMDDIRKDFGIGESDVFDGDTKVESSVKVKDVGERVTVVPKVQGGM